MSIYTDALILFILSTLLFPKELFNATYITCILLLLALFFFTTISQTQRYCLFIGILALFLTLLFPATTFYLPLLFYIFFYKRQYTLLPLYLLPILNYYFTDKSSFSLLLFPLLILGFYLAYRSHLCNDLQKAVRKSRDAGVETELALLKKNQQLLENQDNEIYIATLKERNRIAREIHDNVGHMLSRSILQVGALLAICKEEALTPHLTVLKDTLDTAMNSIRNSVHDLHDEAVDLNHAIEELLRDFTFCTVTLNYEISKTISKEIKYAFLGIIKEALNNTMKHSNATHVTITLREHPAFYQLMIEDNGTIAKPAVSPDSSYGIGLTNMQERVQSLHGIIHISCKNGFCIFISVPKTTT